MIAYGCFGNHDVATAALSTVIGTVAITFFLSVYAFGVRFKIVA